MAVINNVKIYSNDGNTLLFTSTNKVYQVGSDNGVVTDTGLTINFVDYGYPSETYTYTGTRKFLGVATSPNATTPTYSVGSQFTFGSLYTLYIVEGEPEEPKITFNITENAEFTLATKGKYCDKDIAVNVAVPVPEVTTEEKTVTPTKSTQTVTPTNADYLSKVTVNAIPNQYIVPSGTKSITSNGTHDVTSYASVSVNVADIPAVVGTKEITENGTYDAIDDDLEGYSSVTINVPTYITVSSEDELPTDAVDGTIAVVEASGEGYNVTVNFETETPGGTMWGYYLFKNGVYGTDEDVVQEVRASGSSTAQPTPTQISLTNVYSLGLSIGNRYPASESYFGGNYKIDNGSIQTADGFIPITSDCTITFYIPWYD